MAMIQEQRTPSARTEESEPWNDFVHTGPGTLAGRYMRLFWQPVCRAKDLAPARAIPIRIMSEDFTLYRGESGTPHLLAFRCAHRGTQLSTGWVEGDDLRCFYHGWKYGPDGQCIEQPAEPEPFCQKIHIRSYPTQEYLGLIFAYLGDGEAPAIPRYEDFEGEGVREHPSYVRACNFFNILDNDPVHTYFVHIRPGRTDWREWDGAIPHVWAEETEWGHVHYCQLQWPDGRVGRVQQGHRGMPNLVIRKNHIASRSDPDETGRRSLADSLEWRVPVDDEHTRSFHIDLVHLDGESARRYEEKVARLEAQLDLDSGILAEKVLAGALRMGDVDSTRVNMVNVQDDVSQSGQGRIADHEREHLGHSDGSVIHWRNLWRRELRALAEGRPLTEWTRSEELSRSM